MFGFGEKKGEATAGAEKSAAKDFGIIDSAIQVMPQMGGIMSSDLKQHESLAPTIPAPVAPTIDTQPVVNDTRHTTHDTPQVSEVMSQVSEQKSHESGVISHKVWLWLKTHVLWVVGIFVLLLVLVAVGLILWPTPAPAPTAIVIPPVVQPVVTIPSIPTTTRVVKAQVKDDQGQILADGALSITSTSTSEVVLIGTVATLTEQTVPSLGTVQGGFFTITPVPDVTGDISLTVKLTTWPERGESLKLASFDGVNWTEIPNVSVNTTDQTVAVSLPNLVFLRYAVVLPPPPWVFPFTLKITPLPTGMDQDSDGLSDVEESLYKTNVKLADSDKDGYPDGLEIANIYSPRLGSKARVAGSSLVNVYTSPVSQWGIRFLYPTALRAEKNNEQLTLSTSTGELFMLKIVELAPFADVSSWIKSRVPDSGVNWQSEVYKGMESWWSGDKQTAILVNGQQIYLWHYETGERAQANFAATFKMLVRSMQWIK